MMTTSRFGIGGQLFTVMSTPQDKMVATGSRQTFSLNSPLIKASRSVSLGKILYLNTLYFAAHDPYHKLFLPKFRKEATVLSFLRTPRLHYQLSNVRLIRDLFIMPSC